MRRVILLLSRLYPRWWRTRYGDEFQALIEQDAATFRTAMNVMGALRMHITEGGDDDRFLLPALTRNWWLIALGGSLSAMASLGYLFMQQDPGSITFHRWSATLKGLGYLHLAAGICLFAAAVASRKGRCRSLALSGVSAASLGFILCALTRYPIRFRTVALLVILMELSGGVFAIRMARLSNRRGAVAEGWLFAMAGLLSMAFTIPFLALMFGWILLTRFAPGLLMVGLLSGVQRN